jgi:hypothetical protein
MGGFVFAVFSTHRKKNGDYQQPDEIPNLSFYPTP